MTAADFIDVFSQALRGAPCTVVGLHDAEAPLPVTGWLRTADRTDRAVLRHCTGPTLDIGCGPGRMSERLVATGHVTLGIDIVPEAVAQTRARGALALRRSIFESLPGEGRWHTALLADGNIGIGGDPVALLARVRDVLAPGGRVVVDLAEPGTGLRLRVAHLRLVDSTSGSFPWALVGPEALEYVASGAGLVVESLHRVGERSFGVLVR